MPALPSRILPPVEILPVGALASVVRVGPRSLRLRAARQLAILGDPRGLLPGLLRAREPGLRRAAAGVATRGELQAALEVERCSSVAGEIAASLVRAGASREWVLQTLQRQVLPSIPLPGGARVPEAGLGMGLATPERFMETLALRPRSWEAWRSDWKGAGKREQNRLLVELGAMGEPRALPLLRGLLVSMDVDPGRGFAWRRLSALALGRIGDPGATPALLRALEVEAAEHEGRPGAGLGIQFPVRAVLLWALGELQDPAAVQPLLAHLDQDAASALGGLHLPALGALYKLGEAARAPLEALAVSGAGPASERAAALLEVL